MARKREVMLSWKCQGILRERLRRIAREAHELDLELQKLVAVEGPVPAFVLQPLSARRTARKK